MDHICICENGNSKAWYKAPGHFSGTLVKVYIYITVYLYNYLLPCFLVSFVCRSVCKHGSLASLSLASLSLALLIDLGQGQLNDLMVEN